MQAISQFENWDMTTPLKLAYTKLKAFSAQSLGNDSSDKNAKTQFFNSIFQLYKSLML